MIRVSARSLWLLTMVLSGANAALAQTTNPGVMKSFSEVKFAPDDDRKCLSSATESGDPATGPSTFILKAPANCIVPWHYHTAQEQVIVVQGSVFTEMEGMKGRLLSAGGFAMMPSKAKHQFACHSKSACIIFVTFDRVYDIFWVKENPPKSALPR